MWEQAINEVERKMLDVAYRRARVAKTPITLKEFITSLPEIKARTVRSSADSLVKKEYFRRGTNIKNNNCYIIIRTRAINYEIEPENKK